MVEPMKPGEELEVVERYMREHGFRWTAQRRLIARVAFATHEHFRADDLLEMCRRVDAAVSRATVYRTLSMMEQAGFLESLDTGDGSKKFEHVLGHEHHDHMVCTRCGTIIEFRDDALEQRQEAAARRHGFTITNHSLKLFGICQACASQVEAAPDASAASVLPSTSAQALRPAAGGAGGAEQRDDRAAPRPADARPRRRPRSRSGSPSGALSQSSPSPARPEAASPEGDRERDRDRGPTRSHARS